MPSIPQLKKCSRCKLTKQTTDFGRDKRSHDGLKSECRACHAEYTRLWNAENPDKKQANDRRWSKENPDRRREMVIRWNAKYPDRRREIARDWAAKHPDTLRENSSRWNKANPDRRREYSHKHNHNRRARKRGNGGTHSLAEFKSLCERYDNRCLCCHEKKPLTPDHVIPIARGGSNDISNIQPLCLGCNLRKHTKIIDYRLNQT